MTGYLSPAWFHVTDLNVVRGEGCWIYTDDGQKYLDLTAGIAVASTGHCHPKVVEAIQQQATQFIHAQVNCYTHNLMQPLADALEEITPSGIDTFFYASTGAEATEGAVKLAKQVKKRPNIIVFNGSFHGRTHLTMGMTTSKTGYRAGYAPLPAGIYVSPFPKSIGTESERETDIDAALYGLDYILASQTAPSETAAIIIEPEQGEGGYVPAPQRFLEGVYKRAKDNDILFIADEVQAGFGRTGTFFAMEHFGFSPDVIVMAKGIASGFPFAAIGASKALMDQWPVGSHGSTYGGNPIGCAAALATIDIMKDPAFFENVNARGEQLRSGLRSLAKEYPAIADVRGFGLMVATEFRDATGAPDPARCAAVIAHCREHSNVIMMNAGTWSNNIRFMPPLVINEEEITLVLDAMSSALAATA